ncbi:organic cation transporter protein-like isoform X2 [Macrobrachium nipponense]|uniref:organic cation transporter protein-like isoform X2 n=1 Tax=Macrobrachium nipponense TaxID=159736 RepID=UPI0030C81B9C
MIGSICHLMAVMLMATVPSFPVIITMRFILGVMISIMLLPAWSLALEVTPPKHRSLVGMLMGLPYSFFTAINAGVAYFIRTWKYILLVGILPGVILLPLAFFIDESPRWLIQKGREEEAIRVLNRAVELNKTELSIPLETTARKLSQAAKSRESEGASEDEDKETLRSQLEMLLKYIRSPAMRLVIFLMPPLWFTQSFLYLSVSINANNFTTFWLGQVGFGHGRIFARRKCFPGQLYLWARALPDRSKDKRIWLPTNDKSGWFRLRANCYRISRQTRMVGWRCSFRHLRDAWGPDRAASPGNAKPTSS